MGKCKITVVKRAFDKELTDKYREEHNLGSGFGVCDMFKDGEVFISKGEFGGEMPDGFCSGAWDSIDKYAAVIGGGGKLYNGVNKIVACCNDAYRPVSFLMEPAE